MNEELALTLEDHKKAQQEVAFLLNTLSQTIPDVIGSGFGIVGRIAGMEAAKKMPLYFESSDLESVIGGIKECLQGGFDFTSSIEGGTAELIFRRCILREICRIQNLPLGENLCELFHNYMNGMINQLIVSNFKLQIIKSGDTCVIRHTVISN